MIISSSKDSAPVDLNSAQAESIQAAVRWVVGGAAGILTVLAAGIQLTAVGPLRAGYLWHQVVAIGALLVALIAVGVTLYFAARVLLSPGWSLQGLAHVEVVGEWERHPLRDKLEGQRGMLVADATLHPELLYRRYLKVFGAWTDLLDKGEATLPANLDTDGDGPIIGYKLSEEKQVKQLEARLGLIQGTADRIASAANLIETRRRYDQLLKVLVGAGATVVISLVGFVIATAVETEPLVTTPTLVQVQLVSDREVVEDADLDRGCAGLLLDGVAVAGTLTEPVVVTRAQPGCSPRQVRITHDLGIATPVVTK